MTREASGAELKAFMDAATAKPRGTDGGKPTTRERTTRFTVPIRLSLREALERVAAEIDGRVRPVEQTIDKVASTDVVRAALELLAEDPRLVTRAAEKVRRARGW